MKDRKGIVKRLSQVGGYKHSYHGYGIHILNDIDEWLKTCEY